MADGALSWTFNPWRENWLRPAGALAACLLAAIVLGYSVAVPNYPAQYVDSLRVAAQTEVELDSPAAAQLSAEDVAQIEAAREHLTLVENQLESWRGQWVVWSALSLAFLLGMTLVMYVPVRYRLDATGVKTWFLGAPTHRPWEHYRNYYPHKRVVHMTTMPAPSRLDPFRGHPLQFAGNRAAVLAYIKQHLGEPKRGGEEGK